MNRDSAAPVRRLSELSVATNPEKREAKLVGCGIAIYRRGTKVLDNVASVPVWVGDAWTTHPVMESCRDGELFAPPGTSPNTARSPSQPSSDKVNATSSDPMIGKRLIP